MIYLVEGVLDAVFSESVVIVTHGVGYEICVPETLIQQLPAVQTKIKLYTYHYIREDAQQLFGFIDATDRDIFIRSIKVNGLGPKGALKVFSQLTADQFISAVVGQNLATLTSVPGIGKKMAEKLVLELKDVFLKLDTTLQGVNQSPLSQNSVDPQLKQDLQVALKTLGYSFEEIKRAFNSCQEKMDASMSLEGGVKLMLKYL